MEQPRDRLVRYVDNALAAETAIAEALESSLKEIKAPEACRVLEQHLMVTKEQAVRLERRLRDLGGQPSAGKGALGAALAKVTGLLQVTRDVYDRTTLELIQAFATEHLEIGMYAALATFARAYGDVETAAIAERNMGEEQQAAGKLRPLIIACAGQTFADTMKAAA